MASALGFVLADFGSAPGTTDIVVSVATPITASAAAEAFVMADSTAVHNETEHLIAPLKFACGEVVVGVGFKIFVHSDVRLTGQFKVRWVWAD